MLIFTDDDAIAKWVPSMFTAYGKTFFDVSITCNDYIYMWIYVLDLPNKAKNFEYLSKLVNPFEGNNVRSMPLSIFKDDPYIQARSMVESHDEVIENRNFFVFDIKAAKKYLEGTNQLKYSLAIGKCGVDD